MQIRKIGRPRKLVCGIGINDADYPTQVHVDGKNVPCPFFSTWKHMLKRCYDPKSLERHPTYNNCTVHPEWHTFSTFRKWMETQDWQGKQLDKDLLIPGNKVYSPDTCLFVSSKVNSLLNDRRASRGQYPIGVRKRASGKFEARCSNHYGKQLCLGVFDTVEGASETYKAFKAQLVQQIAEEQSDPRVKQALLNHLPRILG